MNSPSEIDGTMPKRLVRTAISRNTLLMVVAGIVAGASITALGTDAVIVPFVGSVPGTFAGVTGLVVGLAIYRRRSCCNDCGTKDCGCTGDCGDSRSYDP